MVKKLYLIGIGPGDIKYLTLEAKSVIERLSLFYVSKKEGRKEDLTLRKIALLKAIKGDNFKIVALPFPERTKGKDYREKIKAWRTKKAKILREALVNADEEEAGFLIWGDPSLFDGHIDIMREIERELPIAWEVIPGLSSFQVLCAKERISLTEISTPVIFHTPRTLLKSKPPEHPAVVFLDNYETFQKFKDKEFYIHWGAYVGSEEELYVSGMLSEVWEKIHKVRKNLKNKKGYLMEVYVLKPIKSTEEVSDSN